MPYMSVYMYGLKSLAAHLLFLDDVKREAVMELDVEYYVTYTADAITLVKPKHNVMFPNGTTGKFLLLSSYQKNDITGSLWNVPLGFG